MILSFSRMRLHRVFAVAFPLAAGIAFGAHPITSAAAEALAHMASQDPKSAGIVLATCSVGPEAVSVASGVLSMPQAVPAF